MNDDLILWRPHPGPQTHALECKEFEVLYGGARGGGKTDAGIAWLIRDVDNPKLRALIVRRNSEDLKDWIDRANTLYSQMGAVKVGNPPEFHWPSGAVFRTGHLNDENAYTKYQGHEYQRMLIEELTQIPTEISYLRLRSACRSTVPGLEARLFMTTNPGEIGHQWVKERFIDLVEWGKPYRYTEKLPDGRMLTRSRIFIHAQMDDNPTLIKNDPGYVLSIEEMREKDPERYKAWRWGSWDVFAGQVFKEWDHNKHVLEKNTTPKPSFKHFLWMDWGYSEHSAYAAYASAVIPMKTEDGDTFNRVYTYQEWYGNQKAPNEWARRIYEQAEQQKFVCGYVDPAMLNTQTDGSRSIADLFMDTWKGLHGENWCTLERSNNDRIKGVATVHEWLSLAPDGMPYWVIAPRCINLIRTLPKLVYDEHKKEDVDTHQEDHAFDASKYGLSQVRFVSVASGQLLRKTYVNTQAVGADILWTTDKNGNIVQSALDLSAFERANPKPARDWKYT